MGSLEGGCSRTTTTSGTIGEVIKATYHRRRPRSSRGGVDMGSQVQSQCSSASVFLYQSKVVVQCIGAGAGDQEDEMEVQEFYPGLGILLLEEGHCGPSCWNEQRLSKFGGKVRPLLALFISVLTNSCSLFRRGFVRIIIATGGRFRLWFEVLKHALTNITGV